jgi:molecular chaperone DnaK (HSP70)
VCLLNPDGTLSVEQVPITQLIGAPDEPHSIGQRDLLPSAVWFKDARNAFTGQEVKDNGTHLLSYAGSRIVRSVKRRMGDPTWAVNVADTSFNAAQVSALLLRSIYLSIHRAYPGDLIASVAIGIPACFSSMMRRDTLSAATMAGFDPSIVTLVDEPAAAIFAGATNARAPLDAIPAGSTALVFDMGGGTLDVSILKTSVTPGVIEILGTSRYNELAGNDIDLEIAALIIRAAKDAPAYATFLADPLELTADQRATRGVAIMEVAEYAKRQLAEILKSGPRRGELADKIARYRKTGERVRIDFSLDVDANEFRLPEISLSVAEILECLVPFLKLPSEDAPEHRSVFVPIVQALKSAQVTEDEIAPVFVTGGSAYFPPILDRIHSYFQQKPQLLDPFFSVARGAAVWAAMRTTAHWTIKERATEGLFLKRKGHPFLDIFQPDHIPSEIQRVDIDEDECPIIDNPGESLRLHFYQGESPSDHLMRLAHTETLRFGRAMAPGARLTETETRLDENKIFHVRLQFEDHIGELCAEVDFLGTQDIPASSWHSIAGVTLNGEQA